MMKRTTENAVSVGIGSQISYQAVKVLTQLYPDFFARVPDMEGFLISLLAVAVCIPAMMGFAIYGKKSSNG